MSIPNDQYIKHEYEGADSEYMEEGRPTLRPRKGKIDYEKTHATGNEQIELDNIDEEELDAALLNEGTQCQWALRTSDGEIDFHDAIYNRQYSKSNMWVLRGHEFTVDFLRQRGFDFPVFLPYKEGLNIKVPGPSFSVRDVVRLVGPKRPVDVIEVANQSELPNWTLGDWAEYYCNEEYRTKRLNVISLEFSQTSLANFVKSPQTVREIDWIDNVWPGHRRDEGQYPQVQYYCLMSVAGSYTDFHIDFGGTSVWYHILRGRKVFLFAPPTDKNLEAYESWTSSPDQSSRFFGDECEGCFKVEFKAGATLLIPPGWIHAVYTPEDSLVFGGNFLHGFGSAAQLRIFDIERSTKVPRKYRFPFYEHIQWYAAAYYLQYLRNPRSSELVKEASTRYDHLYDPMTLRQYPESLKQCFHDEQLVKLENEINLSARELPGIESIYQHALEFLGEHEQEKARPKFRLLFGKKDSETKKRGKIKGVLTEPNQFSSIEAAQEAASMVDCSSPDSMLKELGQLLGFTDAQQQQGGDDDSAAVASLLNLTRGNSSDSQSVTDGQATEQATKPVPRIKLFPNVDDTVTKTFGKKEKIEESKYDPDVDPETFVYAEQAPHLFSIGSSGLSSEKRQKLGLETSPEDKDDDWGKDELEEEEETEAETDELPLSTDEEDCDDSDVGSEVEDDDIYAEQGSSSRRKGKRRKPSDSKHPKAQRENKKPKTEEEKAAKRRKKREEKDPDAEYIAQLMSRANRGRGTVSAAARPAVAPSYQPRSAFNNSMTAPAQRAVPTNAALIQGNQSRGSVSTSRGRGRGRGRGKGPVSSLQKLKSKLKALGK